MKYFVPALSAALLLAPLAGGCTPESQADRAGQASGAPTTGAASAAPGTAAASGPPLALASAAPAGTRQALSITPKPKTFEAKGIYVTATSMVLPRFKAMLQELKNAGGNTIVFDAKDEDGIVEWRSNVPLAKAIKATAEGPIRNLKERVAFAHTMGIHVAGRVCCFHDPILARAHPEWTPSDAVKGGHWKELGRLAWVDPSRPEVQAYVIDLAKDMVSSGVDEIQFDYIRFPAMGATQNARYAFDMAKRQKHEIITEFLTRAYNEVKPMGPLVSCDVYGIMAWAQPIDIKITGQKMQDMAKHTDVLCPMDYPSHFNNGFDGIAHPADQPYMFVDKAMSRLQKVVAGSGVTVRPWLQGMPYKVSHFTPAYVTTQIQASRKNKGIGYLLWNAQNKYDTALAGAKAAH